MEWTRRYVISYFVINDNWSPSCVRLFCTIIETWSLKDIGVTSLKFWGHVTSSVTEVYPMLGCWDISVWRCQTLDNAVLRPWADASQANSELLCYLWRVSWRLHSDCSSWRSERSAGWWPWNRCRRQTRCGTVPCARAALRESPRRMTRFPAPRWAHRRPSYEPGHPSHSGTHVAAISLKTHFSFSREFTELFL